MHSRPWIPACLRTLARQVVPARQPGRRRMNRRRSAARIRVRRECSVPSKRRKTRLVLPKARERVTGRNPPVRHRYSIPRRSIRLGGRAGLPAPATPPRAEHLRAQYRPRVAAHPTTTASTARRRKPPTPTQPPRRPPIRGRHLRHRASSIAPRPHHRHSATTSTDRHRHRKHSATTSNDPHRHRRHPTNSTAPHHPRLAATSTDRHRHRRHRAASSTSRPSRRRKLMRRGRPDRRHPNGPPAPIRRFPSSEDRRRRRARSPEGRARDRREPRPKPQCRPGPQGSLDPLRRNEDAGRPRLVGQRTPCQGRRAHQRPSADGTGCRRRSTPPTSRVRLAMTSRGRPTLLATSMFRPASRRHRTRHATKKAQPERSPR